MSRQPRDCNCRGISTQLTELEDNGHDPRRVIAGLPYTLEELKQPDTMVEWDTAAIIFNRIYTLVGRETYVNFARSLIFSLRNRYFSSLINLAVSPRHLYLIVVRLISPGIYPGHKATIETISPSQIKVTLAIPEGHRGSSAFFWGAHGTFKYLPQLIGRPEAAVSSVVHSHHSEHLVTLPGSLTLLSRLRSYLRRDVSKLEQQFNTLQNQYYELIQQHQALQRQHEEFVDQVTENASQSSQGAAIKDLSEEEFKLVSEVTGGIAHYFNNELTVLLGNADLLRNHPDMQVQDRSEYVVASATRLASLTGYMLSFAQNQLLQTEVMNLNDAIMDLSALIELEAGDNVIVNFDLQGIGSVVVDATYFAQLITHIVENAHQAMLPGGGALTIRTFNDAISAAGSTELQDRFVIEVTDTGPGIPDDIRKRAFTPFFSTNPARMGLGLSVVHGIMAQLGGNVALYDNKGAGTSVRLSLPVVPGQAVSAD